MATIGSPLSTGHEAGGLDNSPLRPGSPGPSRRKLHGRAFYKSLGSPKMILAPMVDQSEYAWRLLTRSYMPPPTSTNTPPLLAYTPMLHAALFATTQSYRTSSFQPLRSSTSPTSPSTDYSEITLPHLDGNPTTDRPLIVQFCANSPSLLLSAAQHVAPHCDAVDLNLGCPQGIAKRGHYGAFLQEDQDVIYDMIHTLHNELPVPVTAKIRVLDTREATLAYAKRVLDAGASILTVHGRKREQKGHNTGLADWKIIRYLRESLPPETVIFANGNILQHGDLQRCLDATGVDGVMSAEGNLCDPTIFAAPPAIGEEGREYWRGGDGRGGYRMDAIFRRYLDIIYRQVLEQEPPERKPLFLPSDPVAHPSAPSEAKLDVRVAEDAAHPAKRQKPNPVTPPPSSSPAAQFSPTPSSSTTSTTTPSISKKALKKQQKKLLAQQFSSARKVAKPTDPSLLAMQAHLFHLLRPLITAHTHVRDALAHCRAGDLPAFEHVLALVEEVTRRGLMGLLPDDDDAADVDRGESEDGKWVEWESSARAARECRRPVWICQARVRLTPKEAVQKGGLTLSRKEVERRKNENEGEVEVARPVDGEAHENESSEVVEVPREGLVCG